MLVHMLLLIFFFLVQRSYPPLGTLTFHLLLQHLPEAVRELVTRGLFQQSEK